jgi:hypothetical protein
MSLKIYGDKMIEVEKILGKKEITGLQVERLIILVKNIQNSIKEERKFWIGTEEDKIFLYWGR